jgi:hypothetical protein
MKITLALLRNAVTTVLRSVAGARKVLLAKRIRWLRLRCPAGFVLTVSGVFYHSIADPDGTAVGCRLTQNGHWIQSGTRGKGA